MKFRNALTLAALAALMALPFAANAQNQDRHNDQRGDKTARSADKTDRTSKASTQDRGGRDQKDDHSSQGQKWDRGTTVDKRDERPVRPAQDNRKEQDLLRKTDQRVIVDRRNEPQPRDNHFVNTNWFRSDHSDWRDIANTFGFVADLTLLGDDDTICFDGSVGAYYPISQYDRDCDSSDSLLRDRAELFGRDFFYRDGHRFERRIVMNHGERCYQFIRVG